MARPSAVFLINLIQDVNILRPMIVMASRDFEFAVTLLVARNFLARDVLGIWHNELNCIASATEASIEYFDDPWGARRQLKGDGLLFSASESDLPEHAVAHEVFQLAPASFTRITLQHGYECVGFRHSDAHVRAHGQTASFAADILCSWTNPDRLPSLARSQRSKIHVTGPSLVLQQRAAPSESGNRLRGLVCENLHSVRFADAHEARSDFVKMFTAFSDILDNKGGLVSLRPHPGGQYFVKTRTPLSSNVSVENAPTYRLPMNGFAYGISAPSSVIIEMLLAQIPTAVWRDRRGEIDADAYAGLTVVSSLDDWVGFASAATTDAKPFLARQAEFLAATGMPLAPDDVYGRFAQIFQAAGRRAQAG